MRRLKRMFHVGVDLGKRQDFTAVAVVEECVWAEGRRNPVDYAPVIQKTFSLRYTERVAKGTQYLRVVDKLRTMLESEAMRHDPVVLALDATGVGEPVFEMLQKMAYEVMKRRTQWLNLAGIVFTTGQKSHWDNFLCFVPKSTLMTGMALVFEKKLLKIGRGLPGTTELLRELRGMRRSLSEGRERWNGVGEHDDMVMALALALWGTTYRQLPQDWKGLHWGRPAWEVKAMEEEEELPERI